MTLLRNRLLDAAHRPLRGQTVRISLVSGGNPFLLDGQGEVIQRVAVSTDAEGLWTADLIGNDDLEAGGTTYYRVDERDGLSGGHVWNVRVPVSGGPYWLRDVLVNVPAPGVPVPPVAAHTLDQHSDVNTVGAQPGHVLAFDGATWTPVTVTGGGGDGGGPHTHDAADVDGLDSALDALTALDGRVDALELRPVVDGPEDVGAAPTVHTHAQGDVSGLAAALGGLDGRLDVLEARPVLDSPDDLGAAPAVHGHALTDVEGLTVALAGKLDDAQAGVPGGLATLDQDGLLAAPQLPAHGHSVAQVAGLTDALNAKEQAGTAEALLTAHGNDSGAHPALSSALTALDGRVDVLEARPVVDSPDDVGAAPAVHAHVIADVTGLAAALDTKEDGGAANNAVTAHNADADAHPAIRSTVQALDDRVGTLEARPVVDDPADIGAAPAVHGHAQGDVTGLADALTARQLTSEKDQPSGYAGLSASGKLAGTQVTYATQTSSILPVGDAASVGTLDSAARSNHVHAGVNLTGNQSVAGVKTFTSSPVVPEPTTATQAASKGYVDTKAAPVETLARRPQATDRERYGDVLSTIMRRQATAWEEYTTGFGTFSGTVATSTFTATKLRYYVDLAAAGGTAAFVAVYSGTNPASLTRRAQFNGLTAFTTAGLREVTLDASVSVTLGDYVYVLFGSSGFTTSPRIKVTVAAPPGLINVGVKFEAYGTNNGTAPATLDTTAAAWTASNTTPWWALI